ncbi:flavin reductase family protein [Streptomyces sp. NPDC001351]|uniref:flavin reductase family protein n=1 Tax=Streptomyces sp. NPDC001351 TaxID=3364564 RepID=UPI0036C7DDFC
MQTLDVIVPTISLASGTSRSHELRAADGGALPSFEAGAPIDVHVGSSPVRQHALCNSPRDKGRYLTCVRRDDAGRGGSRTLHRDLTVGRRLRISPPRNHLPLVASGHHVLAAGGIGSTPLLSMAEAPAEVPTAHGVEVDLSCEQGIYGACPTPVLAGEPDHRDEVQTPAERAAGDRITICSSRARTPELLLDL